MGVLFQSFTAMSRNILIEKLKRQRPAVYIKPDIRNVKVLEFYRAHEVFEQARPAQLQLKKALQKAIRRYKGQPGCALG
jgi:NTE family protein